MYSIGLDYGSNSVRGLLVRCTDGAEVASSVFDYPSGTRGILLDASRPSLARQHPGDYQDGFLHVVADLVDQGSSLADFSPDAVVGIGVDTTGSTPLPVDAECVPLGVREELRDDLDAQAWLWKDHTGHAESLEITALAHRRGEPYLRACGGTYSSEWFFSKILHCARVAPHVFDAAHSWVELADYVPAWATGVTHPDDIVRGICAAGHKAMFDPRWGGLPSTAFLAELHPGLAALRDRLYAVAFPSSHPAGGLAPHVAEQVGLPPGVVVAVGGFDAHHGAVGAGVTPGTLVKIIGTSTCDITIAPQGGTAVPDVPGLCGIVPGSVTPDAIGIEAGQSAVGDIFAWSAEQATSADFTGPDVHVALSKAAATLAPGESGLLALDWHNGNRTVLVNTRLSGLLVGQTLHTRPHETYRAHVEATAFGARRIIDRMGEHGIAIDTVVHTGGIADKNDVVNQIYADVLGREVRIGASGQMCALGAAIFGAVAGGAHTDVASAQRAMAAGTSRTFHPDPDAAATYDVLYVLYLTLHDAFGGVDTDDPAGRAADIARVMPALMDLRDRVRSGGSA